MDIPDWLVWVGFTGTLAVLGLIWNAIKSIRFWRGRPKLKIEHHSIWNGRWTVLNGIRYAKFHCLIVRNEGKRTAKKCVAVLTILGNRDSAPNLDVEHKLHWADIDYSYRTDEPEPIDIGSYSRRLDVFFSQSSSPTTIPANVSINDFYCSGSAGTLVAPYSSRTAEAETTVEIGSPTQIVSGGSQTSPNTLESWIAIPISLSNPIVNNQAYLPARIYRVKIRIDCKDGVGDEKEFEIVITSNGQNNSLNEC